MRLPRTLRKYQTDAERKQKMVDAVVSELKVANPLLAFDGKVDEGLCGTAKIGRLFFSDEMRDTIYGIFKNIPKDYRASHDLA